MWRLGVVVALLVTLGVLGCGTTGEEGESPCAEEFRDWWFGNPVGDEFHTAFYSSLDVEFGETAKLTLTLRNIRPYKQGIVTGLSDPKFLVTTPDCEVVWHGRGLIFPTVKYLHLERWEETRPSEEWGLVDGWGEMVTPGDYLVHAKMWVGGAFVRYDYPHDRDRDINLVEFRRVRVGEGDLRAARPEHPPAPAEPCESGGATVDIAYIDRVIDEHRDALEDTLHPVEILAAQLLDANRQPTGALGIRVLTWPRAEWQEPLVGLKCLEGLPLQLVVWPDS